MDFDFLADAADPSTIVETIPRTKKAAVGGLSQYTPPPDKKLLLVDPDSGDIVGHLHYPTEFCPLLQCEFQAAKQNAFSYYHMYTKHGNRRWSHTACDRPTLEWWHDAVTDLITPIEGFQFPWQLHNNLTS